MNIVPGRDDFLNGLKDQIRPLLRAPDPVHEIAEFIMAIVDDTCIRVSDATCREIVRVSTKAINGHKRRIAAAIAEGVPHEPG